MGGCSEREEFVAFKNTSAAYAAKATEYSKEKYAKAAEYSTEKYG